MHQFTRVAWASAAAQAVWETRLRTVSTTWFDVELASVREGLREAALVFGQERVLASRLPAVQVAPDRFAVGPKAADLANRYAANDDDGVGRLLGFPPCCREFFRTHWGKTDLTLAMTGTPRATASNVLGRWLGVRLVPHLPCSWDCAATARMAAQWARLWPGVDSCWPWAVEFVQWPVRYSSLHGIAIVTWPVVKVVTNVEGPRYESVERHIDVHGYTYPDEAPVGLSFPFVRPVPLLTLTR